MKLRFLQLIASLFWGYQTELLLWAIPMGLILELRFLTRWRWELKQADFYKIADLTSLALLGTIIFLFLNANERGSRGRTHNIVMLSTVTATQLLGRENSK